MLKFGNLVVFVLFAIAVAVQYNDPDGGIWMVIYGFGAVVTFLAFRGHYNPLSVLGAVGYVGGFFYLMPDSFEGWYTNEIAREALGLAIFGVWMIVLSAKYFRNYLSEKEEENQESESPES